MPAFIRFQSSVNRHMLFKHVTLGQNLITYHALEKFQFCFFLNFWNFFQVVHKYVRFESLSAIKLSPAVFTWPLVLSVGFPMMPQHTFSFKRASTEITDKGVVRSVVFFMLLQGSSTAKCLGATLKIKEAYGTILVLKLFTVFKTCLIHKGDGKDIKICTSYQCLHGNYL